MATRKTKKQAPATDSETLIKINGILDALIAEASSSRQFDSFYAAKARDIREADPDYFPALAKRFLKSSHREKEVLLNLLRHFKGVEHIKFLQDFIRREPFLPSTGLMILELFNKSDAMIEPGIASRLLDLDSLTQRIKHALLQGALDAALIAEFFKRDDNEKEGILTQLLEETGMKFSLFIVRAIEADEPQGMRVVHFVTRSFDEASFKMLNDVFSRTGNKEIAKVMKKAAHSLRQKGIALDLPADKEQQDAVFKKAVLPDARASGSIDAEGTRIIFMIKPVTIYETKIFNIMTSDRKGVHDIEVINSLRRETRVFINRLMADKKIEFLETGVENAAFLVEEACRFTEAQGGIVSGNIVQWRTAFAEILGAQQQPLIYDILTPDTTIDLNSLADRGRELIEATRLPYWFVVTPEARDSWMKLTNILYSPLVLDDTQKRERVNECISETAAQFFTPQRCGIFKRRLEEFAWFFYSKDRQELAKTALAVAHALIAADLRPAENRFCREIIRSGFLFFETAYKKSAPGAQGSLLADPDSALLTA